MQTGSQRGDWRKPETYVFVAVLVVLAIAYRILPQSEARPVERPAPAVESIFTRPALVNSNEPGTCFASKSKLAQIETRMDMDDIREIMGCNGELVNESRIGYETWKTFIWRGSEAGTGVVVLFRKTRAESITNMGI